MSQSASQAAAFYRDVAEHRVVWTLKDDGGFAAPKGADGVRVMPFWSTRSRVERVIASVLPMRASSPMRSPGRSSQATGRLASPATAFSSA